MSRVWLQIQEQTKKDPSTNYPYIDELPRPDAGEDKLRQPGAARKKGAQGSWLYLKEALIRLQEQAVPMR